MSPSRAGIAIAITLAARCRPWFGAEGVQPLRNTARFAAAFSACALLLKLLVLLHPDMPVGDAMFHAHRFQEVLAGQRLLHVDRAGRLSRFRTPPGSTCSRRVRGAGRARGRRHGPAAHRRRHRPTLWRRSSCTRDRRDQGRPARGRAGGRDLSPVAARLRRPCRREPDQRVRAVGVGRRAGADGQPGAACGAAVAGRRVHRDRARQRSSRTPALLRSSQWRARSRPCSSGGVAGLRSESPAIAVGAGVAIAAALAVALYYAHFLDTYRTEFARIGRETAPAAPDAGGRGIATRLRVGAALPVSLLRRPGAASSQPGEASLCGGGALPTG